MKQFWLFTGVILLVLLVMFLLFIQIDLPIVQSPHTFLQHQGLGAALISIGFLVLDVFLPIPASLVMIANGALFGFSLGTLISLIGGIGAATIGFIIGKQSQNWIADRFVPEAQLATAQHMFARWGMVAIVITRPIPLLSETTAIVAGTSGMSYKQMLVASIAGYIPTAALYALTGSIAITFNSALWSFGLIMIMATLFWFLRDPLNLLLTRQNQS